MDESAVNMKALRKLGYKSDQQGIINRYMREMGQWDTHLWKCRNYILDSVKIYKPPAITFLGSGWLLDIPVEEVAAECSTVNLVDVLHPAQVIHRVSKLGNVRIISDDITGGLISAFWKTYKDGADMVNIDIPEYKPVYDTGLVVSVNVLTQLDSLITGFLVRKQGKTYSELRKFRQSVQKAHINFLRNNDSILITDHEEYVKKGNDIIERNRLVFTSLPGGKRTGEWTWEFDNSGNYYKGKNVIFGVKAIDMVKN